MMVARIIDCDHSSWKRYSHSNNIIKTYTIASTQIMNTTIFAFIAVLVFKLLSPEVLFINKKQ